MIKRPPNTAPTSDWSSFHLYERVRRRPRIAFIVVAFLCLLVLYSVSNGYIGFPSTGKPHLDHDPNPSRTPASGLGNATRTCRNTIQGREYVTDDSGRVCRHDEVDLDAPGCCSENKGRERFTCAECNQQTQCCDIYEICVSCCMGPDKRAARQDLFRSPSLSLLFKKMDKDDSFEVCRAACRTSAVGVHHQNRYRSEHRFCYSRQRPPTDADLAPFAPPNNS